MHSASLGQRAVAIEIARVSAEVFLRTELQRVDEDAHHDTLRTATGMIHQREVAFV